MIFAVSHDSHSVALYELVLVDARRRLFRERLCIAGVVALHQFHDVADVVAELEQVFGLFHYLIPCLCGTSDDERITDDGEICWRHR